MSENQSFEINKDDLDKISKEALSFIYGDGNPETTNIFDYLKANNFLFVDDENKNKNTEAKKEPEKILDQDKMAKYKDIFEQVLSFDKKDSNIAERNFDGNAVDLKKLKLKDYNYLQLAAQINNLSPKLTDINLNGWSKEKYGSSEDAKNFCLNYHVLLEMKNQFDECMDNLSTMRKKINNYNSDLINIFFDTHSDVVNKILNALPEDQLKELEIEKIKGQELKWDDLNINQLQGISDASIKVANRFFYYSSLSKINKERSIYSSFWKIGCFLNRHADLLEQKIKEEENFLSNFDIENYSYENNYDDMYKIIGLEKAEILDRAAKVRNIISSDDEAIKKIKSLCIQYDNVKPQELENLLNQDLDNFANLTKQNDLVKDLKSKFSLMYKEVPERVTKIKDIVNSNDGPVEKIIKLYDLYKNKVSYSNKLEDLLNQDLEDYKYLSGEASEVQNLKDYFNDDFKEQFSRAVAKSSDRGNAAKFIIKPKEDHFTKFEFCFQGSFEKMVDLYRLYNLYKKSMAGEKNIKEGIPSKENKSGELEKLLYRDFDNLVFANSISEKNHFIYNHPGAELVLDEKQNQVLKNLFAEEKNKAQKFLFASITNSVEINDIVEPNIKDEKVPVEEFVKYIFGEDVYNAYKTFSDIKKIVNENDLDSYKNQNLGTEKITEEKINDLKKLLKVFEGTFFGNTKNLSEQDRKIKKIFDELPEKIDIIKDEIKKDPGVVWPIINFVVYFLATVCTFGIAYKSQNVKDHLSRPLQKTKCDMVLKKYNEVLKQIDKVIETKTKIKTKDNEK